MSDWIYWNERKPPQNELVLVDFGSFAGYGLRRLRSNGDLYSEDDFLDDSETPPLKWQSLPSRDE